MRVLLIIAPYYYPHAQALRTELLGIMYLASSLRAHGHEVTVFDPTIEPAKEVSRGRFFYGCSEQELRKRISGCHPDVVGISCHYAYSCEEAYKIATVVKKIRPATITIMGGLFVSVYKRKVLRDCEEVDYACTGESEEYFPKLLSALSMSAPALDTIDGLLYRAEHEIVDNGKKNFINDLDALPFPARDLVDTPRYMNSKSICYGLGGRPASALLTSRSCPHRCAFCNMWLVHGARWRPRSPENVLGEIDEIVNKYNAEHVFIMDDSFTFSPDRAKTICDGIIRKKYHIRWNTPNGISVKRVDDELARLMKRSGCANVCLGIESGSEHIRNKVMKKNVLDKEIINAVECFNRAKIPAGGFIILGMPGEDERYFNETLEFVKKLRLSFLNVSFAIPFPGTALYDTIIKEGLIDDDYLQKIDNFYYPSFYTKDFTKELLLARRKKILLQFYTSHVPQMTSELLCGRLNWISLNRLHHILAEKLSG